MFKKVNISKLHNLDGFKSGKILIVKGKVKRHDRCRTKTGKPYTKTIIQDATGEYTIFLFAKQCIRVWSLLYAKCNVVLTAKIEKNRWGIDPNKYTLRYLSIEYDNQNIDISKK